MTSTKPTQIYRIAALYHFTRLNDPRAERERLLALCREHGICGTLILAHEGINGTVAGSPEAIETLVTTLSADARFAGLDVKYAEATERPFPRLKVKVKPEIVTLGVPDADPTRHVGTYVEAKDWNALIEREDVTLIDTRNAYETAIGTFQGAIDPKTETFRQLPRWADENLPDDPEAPIAMFCTGGIRCEKSTALLRARGYRNVFHLKGGILRYLEEVPPEESRWQGECFVFDERVSVGHGLQQGPHVLCRACGHPVDEAGRADPRFVEGVSCPKCHDVLSEDRKARFAERQRQAELARSRGEAHLAVDLKELRARKRQERERQRQRSGKGQRGSAVEG